MSNILKPPQSSFTHFTPPQEKIVLINKSLYHFIKPNNKLYNLDGSYFGKSTKYAAIAHNGKDIGSIEVMLPDNILVWVKGYVHSKYNDGYIIHDIIYN
jgi:hypothetical protein